MPACRICQHVFSSLKFQTERISICTRCVNTLNNSPEPARNSETRFAEKLARGMQRNAERDLLADEEWKRHKANKTLAGLDAAVTATLHDWITRLLAKSENSTRDFKIMRAHRRGLLRAEGFAEYPKEWADVAHRVRHRDGYKCKSCGVINTTLDVHHIIYLSNHGTNQQSNLITLCRKCHETEHERIFDWPEAKDPESTDPIQPSSEAQTCEPLTMPEIPSPIMPTTDLRPTMSADVIAPQQPRTELSCPACFTELTIPSNFALPGKMIRCPKCIDIFDFGRNLLPRFELPQVDGHLPDIKSPNISKKSTAASAPKSHKHVNSLMNDMQVLLIMVIAFICFIVIFISSF